MAKKQQQFSFDKFMRAFLPRNEKSRGGLSPAKNPNPETPAREYQRRYQELPQNRIRIVRNEKD